MIKKKAVAGGIVALAAVLGGGGIFAWTRRTADTETLADNQKYVYAYVTSIEGNELTYMEVDESVVEAYLASSTEDTENTEKGGDGSGAPGGSDGSGAPGDGSGAQMIARRCRTGCRRKKMATCRAMQHRTEQEVTVEEHRAEMAA